jgi:predicted RNA binding protein YcfA (HicA-like mRNA interferase family)
MSPKLPVVSGDDLVKALQKFGYIVVRQKGSHIRLRHSTDSQRKPLSVPRHQTLKRGLLHRILQDANLTPEQLTQYL